MEFEYSGHNRIEESEVDFAEHPSTLQNESAAPPTAAAASSEYWWQQDSDEAEPEGWQLQPPPFLTMGPGVQDEATASWRRDLCTGA
eukprot:1006447-Pelagomonas_calceolata.AAC.2